MDAMAFQITDSLTLWSTANLEKATKKISTLRITDHLWVESIDFRYGVAYVQKGLIEDIALSDGRLKHILLSIAILNSENGHSLLHSNYARQEMLNGLAFYTYIN